MTSLVDVTQADRDLRDWFVRRAPEMRLYQNYLDTMLARHRLTAEQANAAEIERLTALLREARRFAGYCWRTWASEPGEEAKQFIARIDTILSNKDDQHG